MCQKYDPTPEHVHNVFDVIRLLFGTNAKENTQDILDYEIQVLEMLDYSVETITPYNTIEVFGECAGLDSRKMSLAMYLITLACTQPYFLRFSPHLISACAVLLAL